MYYPRTATKIQKESIANRINPLRTLYFSRLSSQTSSTISQRRLGPIGRQGCSKRCRDSEVPDLSSKTLRTEEIARTIRVESVPCRSTGNSVNLSIAVLTSIVGSNDREDLSLEIKLQQGHRRPGYTIDSGRASIDNRIQSVLWTSQRKVVVEG